MAGRGYLYSDLHFKGIFECNVFTVFFFFLLKLWQMFWRLKKPFSTVGRDHLWLETDSELLLHAYRHLQICALVSLYPLDEQCVSTLTRLILKSLTFTWKIIFYGQASFLCCTVFFLVILSGIPHHLLFNKSFFDIDKVSFL